MKRHLLFWASILVFALSAFAQEEKNGLQITVTRKTTARNDVRTGYYYDRQINRTMGLHVVVKNVSMEPFPAGEIDYSLLVFKIDYYPTHYQLYTGTEALPALPVGESADVVIGAAQINGFAIRRCNIKTSSIIRSSSSIMERKPHGFRTSRILTASRKPRGKCRRGSKVRLCRDPEACKGASGKRGSDGRFSIHFVDVVHFVNA